jgi:ankyrin repeat protein
MLMKQLASEGADFTQVDYRGRAPIHDAAIKGDVEIVKFLIDLRVDLDQLDQQGISALFMACSHRNSEAAKLLNKSGATIIVNKQRLERMLCCAGHEGDLETI